MPKYMCPECEAIQTRSQPVPAGKKIKCPKCEFAFVAKPLADDDEDDEVAEKPAPKKKSAETKKPKEEKKPAKPVADEDEDEGGTYVVTGDKPGDIPGEKVKFEDLRKKFPKSKRGPAMALTIQPSNFMLMLGVIAALAMIGYLFWGIWPFVFSEEGPKGSAARNRIIQIVVSILMFCIYCMICYGATKMHSLESLQWSWVGTILVIIFVPVLGWAIGAFSIKTLKMKEVVEGYEETKERESELRNM